MTRLSTLLALFVCVWCASPRGVEAGPADGPPAPKQKAAIPTQQLEKKPRNPEGIFLPHMLTKDVGGVLAVNRGTITLQVGGKKDPVTYPLHEVLGSGGVAKLTGARFGYRVEDVRVGDIVIVGLTREDNANVCVQICIQRRPSGRVPESPMPNQSKPTYAMQQNAKNDLEDFGIPIPENCKIVMPLAPGEIPPRGFYK